MAYGIVNVGGESGAKAFVFIYDESGASDAANIAENEKLRAADNPIAVVQADGRFYPAEINTTSPVTMLRGVDAAWGSYYSIKVAKSRVSYEIVDIYDSSVDAYSHNAPTSAAVAKYVQSELAPVAEAAGIAKEMSEELLHGIFGDTLPSATLADNSPAVIRQVASLGLGANFWSVGDKIGIQVNGTVGAASLNGVYYAYIIGFNHNKSIEGLGIDFQFGKTADGVSIAFVDSYYNDATPSVVAVDTAFKMNTARSNAGGWEQSYMRNTICPAFLAALPAEWQAVISDCTKYSDNTGGGNDTPGNVTATTDKIWLPAEFEVFGINYCANSAEPNYQKQYEYYANGNSIVKYKHNAVGTGCNYSLRSVFKSTSTQFCLAAMAGISVNTPADISYGFVPCFRVA